MPVSQLKYVESLSRKVVPVVRGNDNCGFVLHQQFEYVHDFITEFLIQVASRFVCDDKLRAPYY